MHGSLSVSDDTRPLERWSESEITRAINRRRNAGEIVCVRVHLKARCADVAFSTPACAGGGGGGRPPNECERQLLELWNRHQLNRSTFEPGNVIAFLHGAEHILN